jgi:hypothetical protein
MLPDTLQKLCCYPNLARVASCSGTSNPYLTYADTTYMRSPDGVRMHASTALLMAAVKQSKPCEPVEPETLDVYLADNAEENMAMHAAQRLSCKHNLICDHVCPS